MVITRLNPIMRGWAAYYRGVVSGKIFDSLDNYAWKLLYKWAKRGHSNKSKRWVIRRYFGKFNKFRNDRWVFGARDTLDRNGRPIHLTKFSWTKIVRHQVVTGRASPDDPDLIDYWNTRRRRVKPPLDSYNLNLLARQKGRCPLCGDHLLTEEQPPDSPREWERWWLGTARRAIATEYLVHQGNGRQDGDGTRLVHNSCNQRLHARRRRENPRKPATPSRLA
jgi:RNA-directed DNA polymerase